MELMEIVLGILLALTVFALIIIGLGFILRKNDNLRAMLIAFSVLTAFVLNAGALIYDVYKTVDAHFLEKSFLYVIAVLKGVSYTAAMFVFKENLDKLGILHESNGFVIAYYVIITVIYVVVSVSVISMISYRFYSYLRLKFIRPNKTYVFSSLNERTLLLGSDIRDNAAKRREKVAVIILFKQFTKTESSSPLTAKAKEKGFLFCVCKNDKAEFFQNYPLLKRFSKKQFKLFLFDEDYKKNVGFINRHRYNAYDAYILVDDNFLLNDIDDLSRVHIVNERKLTAAMLLAAHPLGAMRYENKKKNAVNFMLVGKGLTGEEIFKSAYVSSHNTETEFLASIFDRYVSEGLFYHKYPELADDQNIRFHEFAIEKADFYRMFKNVLAQKNYIVITLGEDLLNIKVAGVLYDILQKHPEMQAEILVRIKDANNKKFMYCRDYDNVSVSCFGDLADVYREDIVIGELNDSLAKAVNDEYGNMSGNAKDWSGLSEFERDSNRSVALNKGVMLANLGLELVAASDSREAITYDSLPQSMLDKAAENEHLRWNAFHIVGGWQRLPLDRNDLIERLKTEKGGYKSKDERKKLHTCLTHWAPVKKGDKESLDSVSQFLGRDMKAYDYMWLKVIFSVAEKFNQKIVRIAA